MRTDLLLDAIGEVRDDYLEDAEKDAKTIKVRRMRIWLSAAAAVFCLMVAGGVFYITHRPTYRDMQQWSTSMTAKDYFANSVFGDNKTTNANASLVIGPCAVCVSFNNQRENLEADGVLPVISKRPYNSFLEFYNGDGSLYKLTFRWDDYTGTKQLELTVAPRELHETKDLILIAVDNNGRPLKKQITVTERDGIKIFAEGQENDYKAVIWQTAQGWYQITGTPKNTYEDVISLLDWFWEHPIDLDRFAVPNEGSFIYTDGSQRPGEYAEILSAIEALGYASQNEQVNYFEFDEKARPVYFNGVFTRGETRIRLKFNEGADKDAWKDMLAIYDHPLSEENVNYAITQTGFFNLLVLYPSSNEYHPFLLTLAVEQGTGTDAWEIAQAIQNVAKIWR